MSTHTPIATQTLSSNSSSVTFSSIPQNYTDLVLVMSVKNNTGSGYNTYIRFNGDTSSLYSDTYIYVSGTSVGSSRDSNASSARTMISGTSDYTVGTVNIMNYSSSATYKTILNKNGFVGGGPFPNAGLWRSFDPITSFTLANEAGANFASGSTFTIYGIAAGNASAKASGGNIVATDGSYWYHAFTSSGTFIPSQALTCDYVVIGGGGGGGRYAGGGGAGGVVTATSQSLSSGTVYTALVGAGGFAGPTNTDSANNEQPGGDGFSSIFNGITAGYGGGGGSGESTGNWSGRAGGATNGSGGGAGYLNTATGGSGNGTGGNGGLGNFGINYSGGGGGGAGANGANASSGGGGAGGAGITSTLIAAMASATKTGVSGYYAGGGGGGGGYNTGVGGAGGSGGGGTGGNYLSNTSTAGKANTGSGGGGGGNSVASSGGSGIIIIRYAV